MFIQICEDGFVATIDNEAEFDYLIERMFFDDSDDDDTLDIRDDEDEDDYYDDDDNNDYFGELGRW